MTFRKIDERLLSLVDQDTGEILDVEAFEELKMERTAKAENMALWVLDLKDEAAALAAEIQRLREHKTAAERKAESLKRYLQIVTDGQKLKTPLVTVSYRTTSSVEVTDSAAVIKWAQDTNRDDEVLKYAEPEISKTAVKALLQDGTQVPGATIVSNVSTVIK